MEKSKQVRLDALRGIILILLGLALSMATTILVCIKGWGLTPKSWWWIIGVYIIGHFIGHGIIELAKQAKK